MIVPVSDPQLVFRPLLIAGKILPLRASKSISRGQGRRNGSEPGAQAESLQCISARIVSVPCIAGGPFPGTAPAAPRGGGPCVANGRLRHMLIGYARVSKTDGSQSLDLQRDALQAAGIDDAANLYHDLASGRPRRPAGSRRPPWRQGRRDPPIQDPSVSTASRASPVVPRADQRTPQLGECPERLADRGRLVPELRFADTGGFRDTFCRRPDRGFPPPRRRGTSPTRRRRPRESRGAVGGS